jgi:hypothetical protein
MRPSHAETARTLLHGRLPAILRIAGRGNAMSVVHATDCAGQPLLLVHDDSELASEIAAISSLRRVTAMITVGDVPPLPSSPNLGRARVGGRLLPVGPASRREAVLEFADANPVADLLDVGRGATMYRMDVEGALLDVDNARHDIDVDDYISAWPDPLHGEEKDLLLDLACHHAQEIGAYLSDRLDPAPAATAAMPVRLDRYGFTVDTARWSLEPPRSRWARIDFPRPVTDRHDLARLLHPALFHDR